MSIDVVAHEALTSEESYRLKDLFDDEYFDDFGEWDPAQPSRTGRAVTLQRGDVALAVRDFGGDGPPVLLLHGLAENSRELLPTAEALADSFRVLLMDQRGHECSTRRPTELSREAHADDVVPMLESLVPGQRRVLAGIGNAYSDEILHRARLPHAVHAAALDADARERLFHATVDILNAAVADRRGLPPDRLKQAKVEAMVVHGRGGHACPVCGTTIIDHASGGASAQFCPQCQPELAGG